MCHLLRIYFANIFLLRIIKITEIIKITWILWINVKINSADLRGGGGTKSAEDFY